MPFKHPAQLYMCMCMFLLYVCHLNVIVVLVNSKPTKQKILDHVVPYVTNQWYELGIKLLREDQESHLDVIQLNHTGDNRKCCMAMFWYWLSTNSGATWKQLISELQSAAIELPVVAANLEKMLTLTGLSHAYIAVVML